MRAIALATLLAGVALPALANVPSAYLACQDKAEGDPCRMVGPQFGACIRDTLCEDPPDDDVDVCVLCVDPCWGRADGEACLQTASNEPGVCELQDRCTDKAETSFLECNRCVPGRVGATDPDEGCQASAGYAAPWLFILLALGWQLRRRRPA